MGFFKKHNLTKYIKGKGIEIGALYSPLKIDCRKAQVTYVDMLDKENLIKQNPEIFHEEIRQPDIVADAEDLSIFSDESMDFIILNHLLEHLPNPIKALKGFYRILRQGGILYLVVPDKRYSFDKERSITTLSHLLQDYKEEATTETDIAHYQEWLTLVELKKEKPLVKTLDELLDRQYRIHFHVWISDSILEISNYMKNNMGVYFLLEDYYYRKGDLDTTFILKKVNFHPADLPCVLREKYPLLRRILFMFFAFPSFFVCCMRKLFGKNRL